MAAEQKQTQEQIQEKQNSNPTVEVTDAVTPVEVVIPPLSAYEKVEGKPYSVEHFKVDNWDILDDTTDITNLRGKIKTIESFINRVIGEDDLEDSLETYKNIMDQYNKTLNIKSNEKTSLKIERLSSYFNLLNKQKDLEEKRRKLLGINTI